MQNKQKCIKKIKKFKIATIQCISLCLFTFLVVNNGILQIHAPTLVSEKQFPIYLYIIQGT